MKVKLLGVDYGEKNVGLALATTPLAEPLEVVDTGQATKIIFRLVRDNKIDALVVGLSEGETEEKTKSFAEKIKQATGIPIYFQDETLSTQETEEKMLAGTVKKSVRRKPTDHFVATQILQDFIDAYLPLEELPKLDKIKDGKKAYV
jgi:putative Holliday junction resolvase